MSALDTTSSSCGARFEPTTSRDTSTCNQFMGDQPGMKRRQVGVQGEIKDLTKQALMTAWKKGRADHSQST